MTQSENTSTNQSPHYVFAAKLKDVESAANSCLAVQIENRAIVLFYFNSKVYAIDNRCPHMGFPLNRGTVKDGVLTCHWYHARFDLLNGVHLTNGLVMFPHFQFKYAMEMTRRKFGLISQIHQWIKKCIIGSCYSSDWSRISH